MRLIQLYTELIKCQIFNKRREKIRQISSLLDLYSFDEAAAGEYAIIRSQLEREGIIISERDTQIASIAVANKLTVVTHNVKEFARVRRLEVEDWAQGAQKPIE